MLARPGYLWAAHVENVVSPEREARNQSRLAHVADPSVPTGFEYLLLYGRFRAGDPATTLSGSSAAGRR